MIILHHTYISASTAGVIAAALGEAYIQILSLVFIGEMNIEDIASSKDKEMMTSFFKNELTRNKKGIGNSK